MDIDPIDQLDPVAPEAVATASLAPVAAPPSPGGADGPSSKERKQIHVRGWAVDDGESAITEYARSFPTGIWW